MQQFIDNWSATLLAPITNTSLALSVEPAKAAMLMLNVDPEGFDELDRRLLRTIVQNFDGGPVGVESLAAALSEERGTLEDVIEPYLIQQGFLVRSARGRMATRLAYQHFGLEELMRSNDVQPSFLLPDQN